MNNTKKRDVLIVPLNDHEELVIASDNSGSIGTKQLDDINVPYNIVSYFSFRVAYMECIAAGASPISITLMNFNGDEAWDLLLQGIDQAIRELGIDALPVTGSSESNFSLQQSATSMIILGKRSIPSESKLMIKSNDYRIAIIGRPLIGNEVIDHMEEVAPLHLFQWFSEQKKVIAIQAVGSKGILYELAKVWPKDSFSFGSELNLVKSSGPATCFIVVYEKEFHEEVVKKAGRWLHMGMC